MSNANRDYAIVYDVKNSLLVLSRPLIFYLTDKNTSNIFVKLVTRVIVGDGIDQYTDIENASSYVLTMRVIKPDDEVKSIIATQHESESIFQFDLTEDFKDVPGKYICELTISNIVNGRQEFTTSDPFNYEVKRSILSNVKNIIEGKDTTVEKLLNDLDATKAELSSQIKEKASITDLEVERARIDSFISLTEGSTTGDAELIDGRIGSDGKTYDNIGNAIRGQINYLVNNLKESDILKNEPLTINIDKSFINSANNVSSHDSYAISQSISLEKNQTILVNCAGYSQNVSIISKVLENGYECLVRSTNSDEKFYTYTATEPINVVISFNKNKFKSCFIYRNIDRDLDEIYKQIEANNIKGANIHNTSFNEKYYNMDILPKNKIITYSIDFSNVQNTPPQVQNAKGSALSLTGLSETSTGCTFQFIFTTDNVYYRMQYANKWGSWKQLINNISDDVVYDLYPDLSMFPKFAVIGDSYASGQVFNYSGKDNTNYNLSWGQNLARQCGTTCLNLSSGGLSTRSWLTHEKGLKLLNSSDPQDIYYLCLGINDYYGLGESYLGTIDDIGTSNDTFYGNYSKIVEAVQTKAPNAKIIMFTVANTNEIPTKFSNAIIDIANHYGIPYVRLTDDPLFTSSYYLDNMVEGHPTSAVYSAMSKAYKRLIEKCVHDNFGYFKYYGL